MTDELDDEERALLEAHATETVEPDPEPAPEPEPTPDPEPEPEPKRTRKPRAATTPVEPAPEDPAPETDEHVCDDDCRVIPAQWDGDPWGDTPVQMRH